ncbi:uncharacterized protein F5147DRAFT_650015 [Suillus discolor]|uniref:Fungal-type protein kinase domain-containing protein n=1 Tax=Suillus discolor TaxID=1912936 RepID=A0A9P7FFE5_9AGAM|nr:uncharacterized protein F5147DRAFT_650015 [Suillus discolor]KAG2114206.1 hypothetical protein F5147DRAFT_650015 [Suillus discolor]
MDQLTTSELNRLITEETRQADDIDDVGHLLPFIFKSFNADLLPTAASLRGSNKKPLYDSTKKTWPLACSEKGQAIEKMFPSFLNAITHALAESFPAQPLPPQWYGSNSTTPIGDSLIQRKPDLCLSDDVTLQWNNILVVAEMTASTFSLSMPAVKTLDTKAYLVFREQPWRRFVLFLSFTHEHRELCVHLYDHSGGIVTPVIDIHEQPDAFKYIMASIVFGSRNCIGFDPTISINLKMTQLLSETFWARNIKKAVARENKILQSCEQASTNPQKQFHSLPEHLPSPLPPTEQPSKEKSTLPNPIPTNSKQTPPLVNSSDIIGKITVNKNEYELLKVLFSHQGLVGRRTVTGGKDVVLNEVKMLEALKGVPGVPRLVEYWLVEMAPDQVDDTQLYRQKIYSSTAGMYRTHVRLVLKPRARPLHEFRSRKELVKAIRDIVLVQKCAVEKHNILHRDCSLNNSMIEDTDDGSRGALIDWEFAARITSDNLYPAGGTGTIPFMSIDVIQAMSTLEYQQSQTMAEERKKATDSSTRQEVPKLRHTYHNDLESVFYVFAWICIMFKGPCGQERHLEDVNSDFKRADIWLPQQWHGPPENASAIAASKYFFFFKRTLCIAKQFDPYFKDLVPLAEEWAEIIKQKDMKMEFDDISSLLDKHLARLPDNETSLDFQTSSNKLAKRMGEPEKDVVTPKRNRVV